MRRIEEIIENTARQYTDRLTAEDLTPAILTDLAAAGYVVVDKDDPSPAMTQKGVEAWEDWLGSPELDPVSLCSSIYRAMIAASDQP